MKKLLMSVIALIVVLVLCSGLSAEAATSSSKNVTVVNTDSKVVKKSVKKVEVTSPAVKNGQLTLYRGSSNRTVQLKTKVTVGGKGVTSKTSKYNAVSYKSGNPSVVSVSSTGVLTVKKNGTATITITSAADSSKKATVKVTVKGGVGRISATVNGKTSVTIKAGSSASVKATVSKVGSGASKSVIYTSSNTKVATVDSKGKITAKAAGTAYITVAPKYAAGNVKATIKVTVPTVVPTKLTADKTTVSVKVGSTVTVGYKFTPANTTNQGVTFKSSNTAIASVDSKGKVKGVKAGTATITITSKANPKLTAKVTVKVSNVLPTSISASNQALYVGETKAINATVLPTNAYDKSLTYTSSNSDVASVSTSGILTAKKEGTATITIISKANTAVKKIITVKVNNVLPTSISASDQALYVGETKAINATVLPANAYDKSLTYSSSSPEVASVDPSGVVSAMKEGTATITITSKANTNVTAKITIKVSNVLPTSISASEQALYVGESKAINATVLPANAYDKSLTYSSSSPEVVSVDPSGVITAMKEGTATITITSKANTSVKKEILVKVSNWTISVPTDTINLVEGNNFTIVPKAPTMATITYAIADAYKQIATVNSNGVVTAGSKKGSAEITVTAKIGGCTKTASVYVMVTPKSTKLTLGNLDKTQFTYTGTLSFTGASDLLTQLNGALSANKAAITFAGLKSASHTVIVDGVTYEVRFDATAAEISIWKSGVKVNVTNDKKTVSNITVNLSNGANLGQVLTKYLPILENVQGMISNSLFTCDITLGANKVTKVGVENGYAVATINGIDYKGFIKDGAICVAGDVTKDTLIGNLISKGYILKAEYIQ